MGCVTLLQARGARPYMEDRHCIVTALKPSTTHQDSSALLFLDDCSSSPQQVLAEQPQQPAIPSSLQDGVERCYAAIFDGHNGAGAAETAGGWLSLLRLMLCTALKADGVTDDKKMCWLRLCSPKGPGCGSVNFCMESLRMCQRGGHSCCACEVEVHSQLGCLN